MNTTTEPAGRRARNREHRKAFDVARRYGLAARRRAKLARIAARCDGQCRVCVCGCRVSPGRTTTARNGR